ncbi:hypothetical protein RRG08_038085 [Elysia crispata]|uniref:Uncharacterized protein n=1 Tax=Elysia crispata TaxID=231223 RepID=A0AAE1A088_9GAST|nr:hypothetical protein RRG08_038085 [Elysia crispata]
MGCFIYKTVFDAWNGYHNIDLDERDRHLTTFITPRGRYRYLVAPQGTISAKIRLSKLHYITWTMAEHFSIGLGQDLKESLALASATISLTTVMLD